MEDDWESQRSQRREVKVLRRVWMGLRSEEKRGVRTDILPGVTRVITIVNN